MYIYTWPACRGGQRGDDTYNPHRTPCLIMQASDPQRQRLCDIILSRVAPEWRQHIIAMEASVYASVQVRYSNTCQPSQSASKTCRTTTPPPPLQR